MIEYSIPDSYIVRPLNAVLFKCMEEHTDWFHSNLRITTAYGFPACGVWNGNRSITDSEKDFVDPRSWVDEVLSFYSKHNITYRFTCTNFLLSNIHLKDAYCNALLTAAKQYSCKVIVSTKLMYDYIKNTFPEVTLAWSTLTTNDNGYDLTIDQVNELSKNDLVVLPFTLNSLDNVTKLTNKENIELLVNQYCVPWCPYVHEHFKYLNNWVLATSGYEALDLPKDSIFMGANICKIPKEYKDACNTAIKYNDLQNYINLGFNKFKVQGRGSIQAALKSYSNYFVVKDHKNDFLEYVKNKLNIVV